MRLRTLDDVMTPLAPLSLDQWQDLRRELLENLRFSSSIDLLKHDAPLNAKVFGKVEFDSFVVEKVIFQSLPGFYVTGNLYRPKDISKKYPAVLNPHGHWEHGRVELSPLGRLPQRCANLAMRGMVAFMVFIFGFSFGAVSKRLCFVRRRLCTEAPACRGNRDCPRSSSWG